MVFVWFFFPLFSKARAKENIKMSKKPPNRPGITFEIGARLEALDYLQKWYEKHCVVFKSLIILCIFCILMSNYEKYLTYELAVAHVNFMDLCIISQLKLLAFTKILSLWQSSTELFYSFLFGFSCFS